MLEIAALLAVVFLVVAAYFFMENNSLRQRVVELDEAVKDSKRSGSAPVKSESAKVEARATKAEKKAEKKAAAKSEPAISEKDLEEARNEVKDLKKQVYDLRSENKDLRKEAEEKKPRVADSDVVFSLREEIAELKGEVSRLETEAKGARTSRPEPKPEPKPEPRAQAAEPVATRAADPAELRALREELESEMEAVRREARKEVADAESRLKKTAANVDKQRRRADNNDRAYKITQRQLDATQERVELLEAQLKKAGFAETTQAAQQAKPVAPKPEAPKIQIPKPEAPKAEAPKPEAPKVEAPKPEAPKAEAPKPEAPKAEVPKPEAPKAEVPKPEAPKAEAPRVEAPRPEEKPAAEAASTTPEAPAGAAVIRRSGRREESEASEAKSSGGTDSTLKSKPVTAEDVAPAEPFRDQASEAKKADEDRGNTAMLSASAVAGMLAAEEEGEEKPVEAQPEEGKRPSSGLFGIPDYVLRGEVGADESEGEVDPARSTQFAFPAQQGSNKPAGEGSSTAKHSPVTQEELAKGSGQSATPADAASERGETFILSASKLASFSVDDGEKSPEEGTDLEQPSSVLENKRLGEQLSEIDDAWADLDID